MIRDARRLRGNALDADVCIVGAGAAGITIARALRGSGLRVVVLESGGTEADPRTQRLYAGRVAGHDYFPLDAARLRFFGGSTNHWNGYCRPLDPIDLEPRDAVDGQGWPIAHGELARWYPEAQRIVQLGREGAFAGEDWREVGRPLPLDPALVRTDVFRFSPPTRFGEHYRRDLADAENVTVLLHANVVDIEPRPRPVVRVARALGGTAFTVRSSALVLACGGIENARLLLAARDGRGIGGDAVGRYFMEHPHTPAAVGLFPAAKGALDLYGEQTVSDGRVRGALVIADDVVRERELLRFSATLETVNENPGEDIASMRSIVRGVGRRETQPMNLYVRSEQAPHRDSRVRLGRERDALGMPRAVLDWRVSKGDLRSIRESLAVVGEALGAAGIGRLRTPATSGPGDVVGGAHHAGTTRMGTERATSVVDGDGRMHDNEAIYVAGSSVFSTGGYANPTLTIVALSLRLAEHLRKNVRER